MVFIYVNVIVFGAIFSIMFIQIYIDRRRKRLILATECGHKTRISGEICVFGKAVIIEVSVGKDDATTYCLECLGKMSIRCVSCGEAIYIGDGVEIVRLSPESEIPDYAVPHPHIEGAYFGCVRMACTCGAGFAGQWVVPGKFKPYNFISQVES